MALSAKDCSQLRSSSFIKTQMLFMLAGYVVTRSQQAGTDIPVRIERVLDSDFDMMSVS